MGVLQQLQAMDAYPKWAKDMQVRTVPGAVLSVSALVVISLLFLSELSLYLEVRTTDHLTVDLGREDKMRVDFDVTFPRIPCSLISADATDVSGEKQLDLHHHIKKQNLDEDGRPAGEAGEHSLGDTLTKEELTRPKSEGEEAAEEEKAKCGDCYGAQERTGQCCNTCDEVREAYRSKGWALEDLTHITQCVQSGQTKAAFKREMDEHHGCRLYGYLRVNKVKGNLLFAPGKGFQNSHNHVHDLAAFEAGEFNLTHRINKLTFGETYPGAVNPLDGRENTVTEGGGMFMYFTKVVPTTYSYISGAVLSTNQYSVTEHFRAFTAEENKAHYGLPGVFVFFELSPIMVRFAEERRSLFTLLTQLCVILAGVFTVSGVIDRVLYRGMKTVAKKMELGKHS